MSLVTGKVISVGLDVDYPKKDGGGSYKAFILKYATDRGEVREKVKPMQGLKFGAGPEILATLRGLSAGDTFSMSEEKKGQYLEITSLVKGEPSVEMAAQAHAAGPTTGRVLGNNYETAEERKIKQRLIVRQAALNQALEYTSQTGDIGGGGGKIDTVQGYAAEFEAWVYRGME